MDRDSQNLTDMERFKDVPRCSKCKFFSIEESFEGIFFKTIRRRLICTRGMPDLLYQAIVYNGDVAKMRTQGYCGIDGRLYEAES